MTIFKVLPPSRCSFFEMKGRQWKTFFHSVGCCVCLWFWKMKGLRLEASEKSEISTRSPPSIGHGLEVGCLEGIVAVEGGSSWCWQFLLGLRRSIRAVNCSINAVWVCCVCSWFCCIFYDGNKVWIGHCCCQGNFDSNVRLMEILMKVRCCQTCSDTTWR